MNAAKRNEKSKQIFMDSSLRRKDKKDNIKSHDYPHLGHSFFGPFVATKGPKMPVFIKAKGSNSYKWKPK
ncbi:hypothetical protein DBR32_04840 [Taibaiella sp. KBW10]|nr:hypothetical protein DBR32_04840 [Taibaiella sp. KBW10]